MCGNIKKLRYPDRDATDEEIYKASLQFVRKVTNYRKPSAANRKAYELALCNIQKNLRVMLREVQQS